jgi:hypothetical protein
MVLPSRAPWSSRYTCAHRSSSPFGAGVPVRPTTRRMRGSIAFKALNRCAWEFLKLDSSSMTTMSKGQSLR